ncbi:GGDEF domain-containing protein [Litchfieldella qijiaojingensis]|uniref:GGDEF domain-containing protein n=1 Tax=Litchfieldella qijiaojingensis TaxID=980347 RepID=A0ABQ2YQW0_9GAMM|nr:LapD/MoxY N-terminal periplasmic domain-containing protein [Halomonas qijiaojingensis]GGX90295.1 GGDEF domain-containing protein [Halomonas qijiaojingensis]
MSLIKQLWLTIAMLLLLAFGGSLVIGVSAIRHYTEQEVRIKNADNANALALSMSQMNKDPVTIELLLAAQFDTGHYRAIELRDPEGELILRRENGEHIEDVPGWFVDLTRFSVPAGQAVVQDGWRQYGTIELQSQHSFAYRSLWQSTQYLIAWFGLAALVSALLAWWIVKSIRRPLHAVVTQARDIGNRRFTTSKEPYTRELRDVVVAMNMLSSKVREMLTQESEKLERLRRKLQHDEVTGVANRNHFMKLLQTALDADDHSGGGTLVMLRVARLATLNDTLGRQETDQWLKEITHVLKHIATARNGQVGRLNGSDFALLLPGEDNLRAVSQELRRCLHPIADSHHVSIGLPMSMLEYAAGDERGELLSTLDGALAKAELDGDRALVIAQGSTRQPLYTSQEAWRSALEQALAEGVRLARYPVLDSQSHVVHFESPSRLHLQGDWQPAGMFMPWVSRLRLNVNYDLAVVEAALTDIERHGEPLGINLSPQAASDGSFLAGVKPRLAAHPKAAAKLWLELPESVAVHYLEGFRGLCRELHTFGCRMGLEHVGPEFTRIADLHDVGLAYIKIDASLVEGIQHNSEQQTILRGMVTLCHSIGILAFAEGVSNEKEHAALVDIGLDGVTGPGIRQAAQEDE